MPLGFILLPILIPLYIGQKDHFPNVLSPFLYYNLIKTEKPKKKRADSDLL
jgi:hypothetical protein